MPSRYYSGNFLYAPCPCPDVSTCFWNLRLHTRRTKMSSGSTLNFAIVGCGGITLQNHLPGLALCPDVKVVALGDTDATTLERARQQTGVGITSARYEDIVKRDDVHAVIIATPNFMHAPIALEAIANGKHVLCEKPLALNYAD